MAPASCSVVRPAAAIGAGTRGRVMGTAGTHSVRAAEFGHIEDASVAKPEAGCGAGSSPPSKLIAPRSTRADPAMSAPARSLPHLLPLWKRISGEPPCCGENTPRRCLAIFRLREGSAGFLALGKRPETPCRLQQSLQVQIGTPSGRGYGPFLGGTAVRQAYGPPTGFAPGRRALRVRSGS